MLLFLHLCCAQSNYKEGYIITNEGDTVNGVINFRLSSMNSSVCKFVPDGSKQEHAYKPGEIAGYRFKEVGKYYITQEVVIDSIPKVVFSEFLLKGIVNLYLYAENMREYYIFEQNDGTKTVVSTEGEDKIVDTGGQRFYTKDTRYIGMIRYMFRDSEKALSASNNIKFSQDDIIDVTKKYHDDVCTTGEACILFETKKDKNFYKLYITPYIGVSFDKLAAAHTINSISPAMGLHLDLNAPRFSKSFNVQYDVGLKQIKGESTNYSADSGKKKSEYKHEMLILSNKLGIKYSLRKLRICPSIEAGGDFILPLKTSSKLIRYTEYVPEGIVRKNVHTNGFDIGIYVGTGIDIPINGHNYINVKFVYEKNWAIFNNFAIEGFHTKLGFTF